MDYAFSLRCQRSLVIRYRGRVESSCNGSGSIRRREQFKNAMQSISASIWCSDVLWWTRLR